MLTLPDTFADPSQLFRRRLTIYQNSDNRLRREVVGQMLDYAAQGAANWSSETLGSALTATCDAQGISPDDALAALGAGVEFEEFTKRIETSLRAGRMRLLFVADRVPSELRRVVEFLNEQMTGVEVLAIEVRQYLEADGDRRVLVPTIIGSTETARSVKGATTRGRASWTEEDLMSQLEKWNPPESGARLARVYQKLIAVGARASWGTGKSPSVTLWIGEGVGCPVSISIYTNTTLPLAINFDFVREQRGEEEMGRLAALVRELPGVAPYFETLGEQNWGMHRGMRPSEVLPDDAAVDKWVDAVGKAASRD